MNSERIRPRDVDLLHDRNSCGALGGWREIIPRSCAHSTKSLFDWIRTGFRNATHEGIQLGVADAMTAVSGGQVKFVEPARIEANEEPPTDDMKPKTTSRKRQK